MATIREQLVLQAVSMLRDLVTVPEANVFRSRLIPITRDITPAIVVREREDSIGNEAPFGMLDHTLSLDIEIHVRGDEPSVLADPIVHDVHKRLMVDQLFTGLALDTQLNGITFNLNDADLEAGLITMNYVVRYFTRSDNLSLVS